MSETRRKFPERLKKVQVPLPSGEWHGFETESLWVEEVSKGKFRVENSPFFAKGVSFEDIVTASEKNGLLIFERVVISSGRSTYRIIPDKDIGDETFSKFWLPLNHLGCTFESADFGYKIYSVDVPSHSNIHEVYHLLDVGEKGGVWGFDEGNCGHLEQL